MFFLFSGYTGFRAFDGWYLSLPPGLGVLGVSQGRSLWLQGLPALRFRVTRNAILLEGLYTSLVVLGSFCGFQTYSVSGCCALFGPGSIVLEVPGV